MASLFEERLSRLAFVRRRALNNFVDERSDLLFRRAKGARREHVRHFFPLPQIVFEPDFLEAAKRARHLPRLQDSRKMELDREVESGSRVQRVRGEISVIVVEGVSQARFDEVVEGVETRPERLCGEPRRVDEEAQMILTVEHEGERFAILHKERARRGRAREVRVDETAFVHEAYFRVRRGDGGIIEEGRVVIRQGFADRSARLAKKLTEVELRRSIHETVAVDVARKTRAGEYDDVVQRATCA